jgi:GTPase-activating protein SAC7
VPIRFCELRHGDISFPLTFKGAAGSAWFRKSNTDYFAVDTSPGIFGVPLAESIRYANVAISLTNEQGESFIYGYVPIVVAKCGVFLKEKGKFVSRFVRHPLTCVLATDVEGIFRLSGSAKRIKDLQVIFNSPDRYGKGLDWTGYTVHDAANILRRYLNQLPEPIVPLNFYDKFRDPIRSHQAQAVGDTDGQNNDAGQFDHDAAVKEYQRLITQLPPLNRQLLLYILDLLAVFSSKSDLNRMNSANLSAIFQPGIISHPNHDMSPLEYKLSQDVLIFLVENQDNFLFGMAGTAVDDDTVKDIQSGPPIHTPRSSIGRSASNASAGADSLRKYGVRRNVSVSSKGSRERGSNGVPSPVPSGSGVPYSSASATGSLGRSNTLPSKKSPGLGSTRFQRHAIDTTTPTSQAVSPMTPLPGSSTPPQTYSAQDPAKKTGSSPASAIAPEGPTSSQIAHNDGADPSPIVDRSEATGSTSRNLEPLATTARERKLTSLFSKSPVVGPSDPGPKDQRPPNKLRKKQKLPDSANESAQSSVNSLHGDTPQNFHTPLISPDLAGYGRPDPLATSNPIVSNTAPTPTTEAHNNQLLAMVAGPDAHGSGHALRPAGSPELSIRSRSSMADASDFEALDDQNNRSERAEKKRNRWRFSSSAKKGNDSPLMPPPPIGQNPGARGSNSSIGSSNRARKSFTGDSQQTQSLSTDMTSTGQLSTIVQQESSDAAKESEPEKKGFLGKWKAKISEGRKEREAEKERAKSPPRSEAEFNTSRHSLSAFAHEHLGNRGRSMDKSREDLGLPVTEVPKEEADKQTLEPSRVPIPTPSAPPTGAHSQQGS